MGDKLKSGQDVFFYYYNETKGAFEKIGNYKVDADGYVMVDMEHCSDYILTDKVLAENVPAENTDVQNNGNESPKTGESNILWILGCSIWVILCVVFSRIVKKTVIK